MLTALDEASPCTFDLTDCVVQALRILQPETEVPDPRAPTSKVRLGRVGIECDRVARPRRPEKDHAGTVPEQLLHAEHLLIEAKRPVEVPHNQMDVGQPVRFDHRPPPAKGPPCTRKLA